MDRTHLNALEYRLFNETQRLNAATNSHEIKMRQVWVDGCKKEIAGEREFLGLNPEAADISDKELDELFDELS